MLQLGLTPSHLSLRFRQIMHARRLGFGTLELSGTVSLASAASSLVGLSELRLGSDVPAMVVWCGVV